METTVIDIRESDGRDDDNDCMAEVTKELEATILNLIFLREYKNMNKSNLEKYGWRAFILTIIFLQMFCLFILSQTFVEEWKNNYKENGASYVDDELYNDDSIWIISIAPLHFLAVLASLIVTGSYLIKSVKPFMVLGAICFTDKKLHESINDYKCGIFLISFNIAMIVGTWGLAIFIAFYGLYFKIQEPSNIILAAIGNLFILEIDDYICECIISSSSIYKDQFWEIKVNQIPYDNRIKIWSIFGFIMIILIPLSFSGEAVKNYGRAVATDGIEKLNFYMFSYYFFTAFATIVMGVPAFIINHKWRNICCKILYFGMILGGIFFAVVDFPYCSKVECRGLLQYNIPIFYIPGLICCIIILYLDIKGYNKWSKIIFIIIWIIIIIFSFITRALATHSYWAATTYYSFLPCAASIFVKFYSDNMYLVAS